MKYNENYYFMYMYATDMKLYFSLIIYWSVFSFWGYGTCFMLLLDMLGDSQVSDNAKYIKIATTHFVTKFTQYFY